MAGRLFCDMFTTDRLMLSFLNRNVDAFCVMSAVANQDQKVKLTKAYLKLRKVKISPDVLVVHKEALKKGPAIYPIRRMECKSFIVPVGNPSLRKNIFNLAAFNSNYTKNPFNFKHLNHQWRRHAVQILQPLQLS